MSEYTTEPLHEAVEQLRCYADLREDTIAAGLREGELRPVTLALGALRGEKNTAA